MKKLFFTLLLIIPLFAIGLFAQSETPPKGSQSDELIRENSIQEENTKPVAVLKSKEKRRTDNEKTVQEFPGKFIINDEGELEIKHQVRAVNPEVE